MMNIGPYLRRCIIKESYGLTVVDIRRRERGTDHVYLEQICYWAEVYSQAWTMQKEYRA